MPTFSVVTLFHNRRDLAAAYLQSWQRLRREGEPVELILGDSHSTDGTTGIVAATANARTICFSENLGFSRGNNALAREATGEVLIFLNYDVAFTPGWLPALKAAFEARPNLGIVGNVLLSVRTREPDHAGVFFDSRGTPFHFRPPLERVSALPPLFPVPAVTGACLAIRRELFDALGGFDPEYRNGYEDLDLCLRAQAAGAEIAVATRSILWHYIGASPGRHYAEDANAQRFTGRWAEAARELSRFQPPELPPRPSAPGGPAILAAHATLQVFFAGADGFREEHSSVHLYPTQHWTRVRVPLPPRSQWTPENGLRLDPSNTPGKISIAGIALRHARTRSLRWQIRGAALHAHCSLAGTTQKIEGGGILSFESTGADPQCLVKLPFEGVEATEDFVLEIWMRYAATESLPTLDGPSIWARAARRLRPSKVLVDLWRLQPGGANGGIKVFALAALRAMSKRHRRSLRFTVVVNSALAEELANTLAPCRLVTMTSEDYEHGGHDSRCAADVLYAPVGFSRLSRPELPQVSVIADLLHRDLPAMLPPAEVAFRERWIVETIACSAVLQCISAFVAQRFVYHYGLAATQLAVLRIAVPEPVGNSGAKAGGRRAGGKRYFLYPANQWPHKNHRRLIEAYERYRATCSDPWDLHLTGFAERHEELDAELQKRGVNGSVFVHGHLAPAPYRELFGRCDALIFPSLYEGFGIPVLEAMTAGIPVACSRVASLPEVGGDACLYFDPLDPQSIATALQQLSSDHELRERLARAGQKRSRAFSAEREFGRLARQLRHVALQG